MAAGVLAFNVELVRVFKHLFISIGRKIPQDNFVTLFDLLPEHFCIFRASPPHMRKRGLHPQDFLHCIGNEFRLLFEEFALLGILVELINDAAHGIAGGVIAAHNQQYQIAHEFFRPHLVHRFGMDHHGDQIVARLFIVSALHPKRLEISAHLMQDVPAHFIQLPNTGKLCVARPIRPEG